MVVERSTGATSTWTDVFDCVLDKGIVIDAWQRVALSLGAIDLVTVKARIVVVSIETYLKPVEIVLSLVHASGAPQDGVLRRDDISDYVSLRADLVVLSACQTAVGKDVPGEGGDRTGAGLLRCRREP
jgi:hypothetical protein